MQLSKREPRIVSVACIQFDVSWDVESNLVKDALVWLLCKYCLGLRLKHINQSTELDDDTNFLEYEGMTQLFGAEQS